jgi:N,N'-diacetyllegionaminate synthase
MDNFSRIVETHRGVYVIAEVGVNHNGNEVMGYKLIDLAAKAGADAVKFQMFYPNELCSSLYRQEELEMLHQYFVGIHTMAQFKSYAENRGLDFIVTPFDFRSLQEIMDIGCSIIKIGSGELTHIPLLQKAAEYGKSIILSTGASHLADVERAVFAIKSMTSESLSLLHCVSTYPAPDDSLNLKVISTLRTAFPDCIVGYSDHSLGSIASSIAITLGAKIIEKHITLDKELTGPDHMASADQFEFIDMVNDIRKTELMLGDGMKMPQYCETIIGRSIVAKRELTIGDVIKREDLDFKRPGDGVRPYEVNRFIGNVIARQIMKDEKLSYEHICKKDVNQE